MEPPPSQIFLAAVEAEAPKSFIPITAASILKQLQKATEDHPPLTTGLSSLDDNVLLGGIPRQSVIGIASSPGTGQSSLSRILALQLITKLLAEDGDAKAMVLDTTGCFGLQALLDLAKGAAVEECRRVYQETGRGFNDRLVETGAMDVLERVGITKVFDVEGVWDVVGEMRAGVIGEPEDSITDGKTYHDEDPAAEVGEDFRVLSIDDDQERRQRAPREDTLPIAATPPSPELKSSRFAETPAEPQPQTILELREAETKKTMPPPPPVRSKRPQTEQWIPPSAQPPSPQPGAVESSPLSSLPPSSPLSDLPSWADDSPTLMTQDGEVVEEQTPEKVRSGSSSSSLRSLLIVTPTASQERRRIREEAAREEATKQESEKVEEEVEPETPSKRYTQPQPGPPERGPSPPSAVPILPLLRRSPSTSLKTGGEDDTVMETTALPVSPLLPPSSPPKSTATQPQRISPPSPNTAPTSFLLIDTLPPLITKLFTDLDRQDAHKEFASLSRLLTSLSRSNPPITVILLNSLAEPKHGEPTSSVFADIKGVPSLGAVYVGMVDLSLMVYQLPLTTPDAELLYGGCGASSPHYSADIRMANVLEVLQDGTADLDRWEGAGDGEGRGNNGDRPGERTNREGRWGAFEVKGGGNGFGRVLRDVDRGRKKESPRYMEEGARFGRRP